MADLRPLKLKLNIYYLNKTAILQHGGKRANFNLLVT